MSNIPVDPLQRVSHLSKCLENETFSTVNDLVFTFRQEKGLMADLPAVFEGALESILERLESVAMFDGESCSFSQSDLLAALSIWLEKAKSYLEKQAGIQ